MQSIFVCNTAGDTLSEINLNDYSVNSYPLDLGEKPVGPHSITYYKDKLIVSNSYNNSISIFSLEDKKEIKTMYIGAHPNDVKVCDDKVYAVCGESNSMVEADLASESLTVSVPVGDYPHNIEIDEEKKIAYVSNLKSNLISIVDLEKNAVIKSIKTHENPTKIFLSKDNKKLYLCESYLGRDMEGYIAIISTEDCRVIKRIRGGLSPVDFIVDEDKIYVINSGEGTLSIVDINKGREVKKIYIGGMPKAIIKNKNDIFISDCMNGRVVKINLKERIIKNITVGREPNAMSLVYYHQ